MPGKAKAWLKIPGGCRQRLPVITKSQIDRKVGSEVDAVLHESGQQPLRQIVAADAKVDRLLVVLHVVKGQLIQWRGRRVLECKRAQDRCAGFAASASGSVTDHTAAEAQVVFAERPRDRVGKLKLMTPEIGKAGLPDREGHRAAARVSG